MTKWQYVVIIRHPPSDEQLQNELNATGREGWEVCSIQPITGGTKKKPGAMRIILKRPTRIWDQPTLEGARDDD